METKETPPEIKAPAKREKKNLDLYSVSSTINRFECDEDIYNNVSVSWTIQNRSEESQKKRMLELRENNRLQSDGVDENSAIYAAEYISELFDIDELYSLLEILGSNPFVKETEIKCFNPILMDIYPVLGIPIGGARGLVYLPNVDEKELAFIFENSGAQIVGSYVRDYDRKENDRVSPTFQDYYR